MKEKSRELLLTVWVLCIFGVGRYFNKYPPEAPLLILALFGLFAMQVIYLSSKEVE